MGGLGSGNRRSGRRKTTVEECLFLDINILMRQGLETSQSIPVFVKSVSAFRRKKVADIASKLVEDKDGNPTLCFSYAVKPDGKKQKVFQTVPLQSTLLCSGGLRWWFTCPLTVDGTPCERRVGMLYLPPGGIYFGCRHCYDLTYRSCQESHRRDRLLERVLERFPGVSPFLMKRAMDQMWESMRPYPVIRDFRVSP